jgi:hypothetical protein
MLAPPVNISWRGAISLKTGKRGASTSFSEIAPRFYKQLITKLLLRNLSSFEAIL